MAGMELSITNSHRLQSLSLNSEPFQFWLFCCCCWFRSFSFSLGEYSKSSSRRILRTLKCVCAKFNGISLMVLCEGVCGLALKPYFFSLPWIQYSCSKPSRNCQRWRYLSVSVSFSVKWMTEAILFIDFFMSRLQVAQFTGPKAKAIYSDAIPIT